MPFNENKIPVGNTGEDLRTFEQTTSAGIVHTEAVSIADPENVNNVAKVNDDDELLVHDQHVIDAVNSTTVQLVPGPFTRAGSFASIDPPWISDVIDWFDPAWNKYNQGFYSVNAIGTDILLSTSIESSNDPSFPPEQTDVRQFSEQTSIMRRYPFGYYGLRYQRLVIYPPTNSLTSVIVTSGVTTTLSRSTPRLINERIPENSHADWTVLAALMAQGSDGTARPARLDQLNRLEVMTNHAIAQSGAAIHVLPRNDINLIFSSSEGAAAIASLLDGGSVNGTAVHNAAIGQGVFSVPATPGSTCFKLSPTTARYEADKTISGGQTAVVFSGLANVVGEAEVLVGYFKEDGVGGFLYGIGWGLDKDGIFVWRLPGNGAPRVVTYRESFNRDKLDGGKYSRFLLNGVPVPLSPTGISILYEEFEWFGVAPPTYKIMPPPGSPIVAHVEETPGQTNLPTVPDPNMRLGIFIKNDPIAGGEIIVHSGCWFGGTYTGKSVIQALDETGVYRDIKAKSPNDNNVNPGFALETLGYNLTFDPLGIPANRWDRLRGINGVAKSVSQPLPYTFSQPVKDVATTNSDQVIAATTSRFGNTLTITVPQYVGDVRQAYGVCLHFGNGVALDTNGIIYPGQTITVNTKQRVSIIREARATTDVEFSYIVGVPAE